MNEEIEDLIVGEVCVSCGKKFNSEVSDICSICEDDWFASSLPKKGEK